MITVINLTNNDIYNYSNNIEAAFCEDTRYFPARINFYIQKNAHILKEGFLEIEETRNNIIMHHGTYDNTTGYCHVDKDKIDIVNKEINDLMSLEQEISLYKLPLSWLDDLDLTIPQINAIMFMIEDDTQFIEEEMEAEYNE